ncbi:hypothetical protein BJ878DRAFT_477791 [Calycina marina]|uniref:Uncharacterized protein n=1 Tax=Calycina marina TaxID=1763456 RepID=A0A9P7Z7U9_9HELO|nr:hypothetical protein BJ878DRAFT_477791 [Calycina marina]
MGKSAGGTVKAGFYGLIGKFMENVTFLVGTDTLTEEEFPDPKTGFYIEAKPDEPGECIGGIYDREVLIKGDFAKGDCFWHMSNMLVHEPSGWIHSHNRMGDTFRWKGEEISVGEVRDHTSKLPDVQDAVFYGVKLASYDGQADAASITLMSGADEAFMRGLYKGLKKTGLPGYAMPRLVKITKEIDANATFMKAKGELLKKGWDESMTSGKLFWVNGLDCQRLDRNSWSTTF